MNRKAIGFSVLGALLLGAAAMGAAQGSFNAPRAKLENERNTVDVVRQYEDGLVLITATTKPTAQQTAPRSQNGAPRGGQNGQNSPRGNSGQNNSQNGNSQNDPQSQMNDLLRRFFGDNAPQGDLQQFFGNGAPNIPNPGPSEATGSGFFINDAGYILTNYHVVEGADTLKVRLNNNKKQYAARVVGSAPDYDLALIKADVPRSLVKPMRLGNSDALAVGQKTIALGAPFGLDFSVTEGIVSAVGRVVPIGAREVPQKVIQTDAAINPGNSGGPLLDSAGEVIGINSLILSPASVGGVGQFAGVGFAIPVNVAKNLLPKLQAGGTLETPRIGVQYADLELLDDDARAQLKLPATGLLVQDVMPGSPAAKAGLRGSTNQKTVNGDTFGVGGDIITAVNGSSVADEDLREVLLGKSYGDTLNLTVLRNGKPVQVTVKLFKTPTTAQNAQR